MFNPKQAQSDPTRDQDLFSAPQQVKRWGFIPDAVALTGHVQMFAMVLYFKANHMHSD